MNPRIWDADMDVSINVGLGAGSRDRDMMVLQAISMKQENIMLQAGEQNPAVGWEEYRNTLAKMVEIGGVRSPELYFKEITPEAVQQYQEAKANQPNPEMEKLQMESQLKSQEMQQKQEIETVQAQADIATNQQKAADEKEIKVLEFQLKEKLAWIENDRKERELQAKLEFEREKHAMSMRATVQEAQVGFAIADKEMEQADRQHHQSLRHTEDSHSQSLEHGEKSNEQKLEAAKQAADFKAKQAKQAAASKPKD
jgi:hypothetical protein